MRMDPTSSNCPLLWLCPGAEEQDWICSVFYSGALLKDSIQSADLVLLWLRRQYRWEKQGLPYSGNLLYPKDTVKYKMRH